MSDLLFSIGADDREFQKALGRIETASSRTAKTVAKIFGLGSAVVVGKQLIHAARDAIEGYAGSSDAAKQRIEDMVGPWKAIQASAGEILVDILEPMERSLERMLESTQDLASVQMPSLMDSGKGFFEEWRATQTMVRNIDAAMQGRESARRIRKQQMADILGTGGDAVGSRVVQEDIENVKRKREIGSLMGISKEEKDALWAREDIRHGVALKSLGIEGRLADYHDLVSEQKRKQFNVLELNSVGDRATRSQILGSGPASPDYEGMLLREQRELKDLARKQVQSLINIDRNTGRSTTASYAP
jgi:hypothetical protein